MPAKHHIFLLLLLGISVSFYSMERPAEPNDAIIIGKITNIRQEKSPSRYIDNFFTITYTAEDENGNEIRAIRSGDGEITCTVNNGIKEEPLPDEWYDKLAELYEEQDMQVEY